MSEDLIPVYTPGTGTQTSATNPWDSWDAEMSDNIPADLAAEIEEYSKNRYEDAQSSEESREVLAMWKERNDSDAKQYQWLRKGDYRNEEERTGRVMSHVEFIKRLRKAGVICFYRQHPHNDKAVLFFMNGGVEEMGPWVQKGNVPELSFMDFDDHGVPLAEKRRGWRTPLLQLILKGAITEDKAIKYFGRPKLTAAFARYNSTLYAFRNRSTEKV